MNCVYTYFTVFRYFLFIYLISADGKEYVSDFKNFGGNKYVREIGIHSENTLSDSRFGDCNC